MGWLGPGALWKREDSGWVWADRTLRVPSVLEPQPGRWGVCSGGPSLQNREEPCRDLASPPGCLAKCSGWRGPVSSQTDEGVCGGLLGKGDGASENSTALALGVLDTEFLPCHVFAADLRGAQGSVSPAAYRSSLSGPSSGFFAKRDCSEAVPGPWGPPLGVLARPVSIFAKFTENSTVPSCSPFFF